MNEEGFVLQEINENLITFILATDQEPKLYLDIQKNDEQLGSVDGTSDDDGEENDREDAGEENGNYDDVVIPEAEVASDEDDGQDDEDGSR